ncbi:MAG: hypothetical protein IJZ80_07070, partial [Clostridia bacterium]|nr:hypothetical protein [Clostridia bacterium]
MAMNGLEKITDKILAEAGAESQKILAEAEEECARIRATYAEKAQAIRLRVADEAEREGIDLVSRSKNGAATQKRNALLRVRGELVDETFDMTLMALRSQSDEKYTEMLTGLLCAAFLEQMEAEITGRTLYGEEDAIAPERYEVLFNSSDRDRYGAAVLAGARLRLAAKVDAEKLEMLTLSDQTVNIDGGLILRCGEVESNCSLSLLFADL